MPAPAFYLDRPRAESFGSVAHEYDAHRPDFPVALLDEIAALGGRETLDVGTGTGKVARALGRRGLSVLGVEVDARMAAVAQGHGVRVEVARFEDWDDRGRRFDLVTCGDAWHWIDPKPGAAKVALVLRSGGAFVWFWNLQLLEDPVLQALDPVYREHAPEASPYGRMPPIQAFDPIPLDGPFEAIGTKIYRTERRASGAEWAAFAGTISDHRRLPPERLAGLKSGIVAAVDAFGEPIRVRMLTTAHFWRRVAGT